MVANLGQVDPVLRPVGQHDADQLLKFRTEFLISPFGRPGLSFIFQFSMFKFKKLKDHQGDEVPHFFYLVKQRSNEKAEQEFFKFNHEGTQR